MASSGFGRYAFWRGRNPSSSQFIAFTLAVEAFLLTGVERMDLMCLQGKKSASVQRYASCPGWRQNGRPSPVCRFFFGEAMFFVYVLWSDSLGRSYTGSTQDLAERLRRHNAGHCLATRAGIPWRLIYQEQCATRSEAMVREKYYKTGRGRDELNRRARPLV
jgi:putative endonuclease